MSKVVEFRNFDNTVNRISIVEDREIVSTVDIDRKIKELEDKKSTILQRVANLEIEITKFVNQKEQFKKIDQVIILPKEIEPI